MRSIELHVIESDEDLDLGLVAGLLEVEDLADDLACTACLEEVGHVTEGFVQFAIVLDHVDRWFMCMICSADVLDGTTASEEPLLVLGDDADDEYEDFNLDD
jgi:hypothetical protein